MIRPSRFYKSIEFILFAVVFLSCAYFYPGAGHNEASRFDSIRAIVDEQRLIVDTFAYNSADLINVNNHFYSGKAPGLSLIGLPSFAVLDRALRLFPIENDLRYHMLCYLTGVFSVGLFCALLSGFLFRYVRRSLGGTEIEAVIVSLTLSLATLVYPFSTIFFSHVVTAALCFFAFYLVQSLNAQNRPHGLRWILLAGFFLGFAFTVEFPAGIAGAVIGLYTLVRLIRIKRARWLLPFCLAGLAGVLPLLIYNKLAFGNAFFLTYEAYKSDSNAVFQAQREGFYGIHYEFWKLAFLKQFARNLLEITLLPLRGLLYLNPILWLVPIGFIFAIRSHWRAFKADIVCCLFVFLGFLAMTAAFGDSIVYWGGGASFGPRYVIPPIPFLVLPLFFALREMKTRFVFPVLAFVSAFFCLLASSIDPHTPYAPDNPIFEFYLPKFIYGKFSMVTDGVFSQKPVIGSSVAFNWGKLLHLPGAFELLPLFAIWIFAAIIIEKRTHSGYFSRAVIFYCIALSVLSGALFFRF